MYLEELLHVYFDVLKGESRVEFPEVLVREMFSDKTSCPQVAAFDYILQLEEVRVLESLQEMVLSFDLNGLHRQEHLNGNFLLRLLVASLEDMSILAPSDFMRYGILFLLTE